MTLALGALIGISLVIQVMVDPGRTPPRAAISVQTQQARMRPLIRSANECIAQTIVRDPRFGLETSGASVNDLIVDSMPACIDAVRAIIDEHDDIFGAGTGEIFFMGPFLDTLPVSVQQLISDMQH